MSGKVNTETLFGYFKCALAIRLSDYAFMCVCVLTETRRQKRQKQETAECQTVADTHFRLICLITSFLSIVN